MRLAGLSLALAAATLPASAWGQAAPARVGLELRTGETLLEVEDTGVDRRRPDVLTIEAGVVTTGTTAAEASAANAELAGRLVAAVRGQGIAAADVQTRNLSLQPRFARDRDESEDRPPRITGYVARNQLVMTLRDLGRAGQVLSALYAAGANSVEGPRFSLSDPVPARRSGRAAAIAAARTQAEDYAAALGLRVARVLRVSERGASVDRGDSIVVTGSRIAATPVEPGEVETEVRVWVDFALAPR